MVDVHIRIPSPSSMLVANLIGVLGLLAIIGAVMLLAGWAWGLLAAGAVLVALSVIAATHAESAEASKSP